MNKLETGFAIKNQKVIDEFKSNPEHLTPELVSANFRQVGPLLVVDTSSGTISLTVEDACSLYAFIRYSSEQELTEEEHPRVLEAPE